MADIEEVSAFMQKASKKTRSYFVNAGGLNAFLAPISIYKYLKRAQEQNQLDEITKHHYVDMDDLLTTLEQMNTNE